MLLDIRILVMHKHSPVVGLKSLGWCIPSLDACVSHLISSLCACVTCRVSSPRSCTWEGRACDVATAFRPVWTGVGVCYSFRPPNATNAVASETGHMTLTSIRVTPNQVTPTHVKPTQEDAHSGHTELCHTYSDHAHSGHAQLCHTYSDHAH